MAALKSGSHACRLDRIRDMYAFFSFCFILSRLLSLLGGDLLPFTRFKKKKNSLYKLQKENENQITMLTNDAKPPMFTGVCICLLFVIVLLAFDNFNNDKASRK